MKQRILNLEEFIMEGNLNEAQAIRISGFTILSKVYQTMKDGLPFKVVINGIQCAGYLNPMYSYTGDGLDCDELIIGVEHPSDWRKGDRVLITQAGGGHRHYAIHFGALPEKEKQPKSLRFTGAYLETKHLGEEFKRQLTDIVINHPDWLTDKFKDKFGLK